MADTGADDESNFRGHVTQKAIVQRPDEHVPLVRSDSDRLWTIPGGRVQDGEEADEALEREIREETGLSVTVERPVETMTEVWHTAAGEPMFTVVYACSTTERAVTLNHEHDESEWVPVEEAVDRMPIESLTTAVQRACGHDG